MENRQIEEKLTAMEQLIHWIDSDCTPMDCVMKAKELLKSEKEQIMSAYMVCDDCGTLEESEKYAEQYYNKTYERKS